MGGGIKSKFKFPIPGRSSKKHEVPTVSIPGPMSKAQRILGADGINIGSSRRVVDAGRSWETGSTGGISISISEDSVSQAEHDTGFDREDGKKSHWEVESAIIPRQSRSAHGSSVKGLATKRSALTVGNESRDNVTSVSLRGRRQSSSTVDTHYDSTRMPLTISQQTSNSAIAKGLPTKVNELLDMDGSLAGAQYGKKSKKKPAMLDLSRLRPKASKERNRNPPRPEHTPNNTYMMTSPSFGSQTPNSVIPPSSVAEGRQGNLRKFIKQIPTARQSPLSKGITEPTGLHQLYHHYEQMSFQEEERLEAEADRQFLSAHTEGKTNNLRPISTFTHSLIAPIQLPQELEANWGGHSRNSSHDSRLTASVADSSGGLQVQAMSRKDYAGSVSSRHTRTSKASPSCKSLVESDRLQNSVLSLSDSSDDEAIEASSPPPLPRSNLTMTHDVTSSNLNQMRSQQSPNHHGTVGTRKFTPSLNQVDEHLAVKAPSKAPTSRSPSNNTLRSSNSSANTVTPAGLSPNSRLSPEALDTLGPSYQPGYGVQQATAVPFVPLPLKVETTSKVSAPEGSHHLDNVLLRQNSTATSHFSRSSGQPTPPLSPNSVEFYVKSRESLQRDAMAGGSSEAHNARLMAVTRQEEMLLAALRQKRAKMRETVISEAEEDGKGRISRSRGSSLGSTKKPHGATREKNTAGRQAIPNHHTKTTPVEWPLPISLPAATGSRKILRSTPEQSDQRRERSANRRSVASRGDVGDAVSSPATESSTGQILMYFDEAIDASNTDPGAQFAEDYMDDSDGEDLIVNERRSSRMQSRRDSASGIARRHGSGSVRSQRGSPGHSSQRQKDPAPSNVLGAPSHKYRLQDVPEVETKPECNEDVDADSSEDDTLDEFPQPPMPPPSWPLPPRPEKPSAKPSIHTASNGLLHPSSAMMRDPSPEFRPRHIGGKRSGVRLSAVGRMNSPIPAWGDED